ncbi:MAG: FAD:protein FMN transferase [Candidatus Omnitrophica bacterium]|nr:FAD:protein FMN transferase [Candidatus Omnitrophota bacterium]
MSILFFLISLFLSGCSPQKEVFKREEMVLGTFGEITCFGEKDSCKKGIDKAFREIKNLEEILSFFKAESDISFLNNAQGKPVGVKKETLEVLKKAKEISQKTQGAFEVTVAPLLAIWGFYQKEKESFSPPSGELIKETLALVGQDKIILAEDTGSVILKNPSMKIDLGGLAKGYIVDRAVAVLKKEEIKNALVNLGGDIFCLSEGRTAKVWKIGIQDPQAKEKLIATLKVRNKAIATSGQYENFREFKGKKLGHIIDPRTGYPVENDVLSVTVVASDCLTADALATAIFVLGKEQGSALLKTFSAEAVIISKSPKGKRLWISGGLKNKVSY